MLRTIRALALVGALLGGAWILANAEITVRVDHLNLPIWDEPPAAEPTPAEEV